MVHMKGSIPPAPRAHGRPLRMRLLLLAASGLLPLLIVLGWGINHLVDERQHQTEKAGLELSRALANAIDGEHRYIVALLEHMGTSDELERADFRAFHSSAERTASELDWISVVLTDGDGRAILRTSEPFGTTRPAPVEPESLQRVLNTNKPAVSRAFAYRSAALDTFVIRTPVMRQGRLVYVLSAYLPTEMVGAMLRRQNIPAGSTATVFDQTYYRIARSREAPSRRPSATLQAMLDQNQPSGAGQTVSVEGVPNYTGYTRMADSGWVVAVGNSVAEANQGLHALLRALALGLAASLALAVALAWVLSRQVLGPIETLTSAAGRLGRGEPVQVPPLDIAELNDVGVALNDAVADRDRAAEQVAAALRLAEEANRSKDQFLAMLGHELRNPLAPISNAVQIMAIKGDDRTAAERRIIERQLVHVTRLVDDLLDVSRITSGRLAIRKEPVRMGSLLVQLVDNLRMSLHNHMLQIDLGPGVDDAWVAGDETRLAQVFNNLLVNGVKFTPPGGKIILEANLVEGELRVEVHDTGVGMSQEDLDHVFELFYQAPQSSDRARGGLGLGLPIVKSLVEMHGGSVHAASAGPGKGSCMTVRLPTCMAPALPDDSKPQPDMAASGNVLVVDDNEDAADTCAALLEMCGYAVQTVYRPEAALALLTKFKPDVAILDIGLPGISGYALASLLKEAGYRGALVALTGYGQASDLAASKAAGFDAHMTKPVAPAELMELVARLAARELDAAR